MLDLGVNVAMTYEELLATVKLCLAIERDAQAGAAGGGATGGPTGGTGLDRDTVAVLRRLGALVADNKVCMARGEGLGG